MRPLGPRPGSTAAPSTRTPRLRERPVTRRGACAAAPGMAAAAASATAAAATAAAAAVAVTRSARTPRRARAVPAVMVAVPR